MEPRFEPSGVGLKAHSLVGIYHPALPNPRGKPGHSSSAHTLPHSFGGRFQSKTGLGGGGPQTAEVSICMTHSCYEMLHDTFKFRQSSWFVLPGRLSFTLLSQFAGEVLGTQVRKLRLGEGEDSPKVSWPESYEARARVQAYLCLQTANTILLFLLPTPCYQEHEGALPLSLSLSFVSVSQSDRSNGHQQEKGVHCTRPQAGHPPLDNNPQRVPEESWQQAPPPSRVPASATFSAGGVISIPFSCTLPPCWHCPGQRAKNRVSLHSASPPQDTPRLGVFL